MLDPLTDSFPKIQDQYELLENLGQGGMGTVYKVRHRLLGETRILKTMRPHVASDPVLRRRFVREAKLATRLRHGNVAQLFDFAVDEAGIAYILMEFIDGVTFRDLLLHFRSPSLPLCMRLIIQGLRALGCLHRNGIVHRDIADDNLMVIPDDDGEPLVKLIDLGIAKDDHGAGDRTTAGHFLGKVQYAPPEMFEKDSRAVDHRGDIYSFGVLTYQILTGRLPFEGHGFTDFASAHLFQEPLPFTKVDPDGKLPEGLREVVLRALAKNREERVQSTDEFIELLRPFESAERSHREELGGLMQARSLSALCNEVIKLLLCPPPTVETAEILETIDEIFERSESSRQGVQETLATMALEDRRKATRSTTVLVERGQATEATPALEDRVQAARPTVDLEGEGRVGESSHDTVAQPVTVAPVRPRPPVRLPRAAVWAIPVFLIVVGIGWILMNRTPAPPPEGTLVLDAIPWARVVDLQREDGTRVESPFGRHTPLRARLPAGTYRITLANPMVSEPVEVEVDVSPAVTTERKILLTAVDPYDYFENAGWSRPAGQ